MAIAQSNNRIIYSIGIILIFISAFIVVHAENVQYKISTLFGPEISGYYFSNPMGIFISNGNYYFTDTLGHTISRMSENGEFAVIAGTGVPGFNGDGQLATSSQISYPNEAQLDWNGDLIIADSENHRIRKVSNGIMTTIAGTGFGGFSPDGTLATESQLSYPVSICISAATKEIYFSERDGHRVRKITENGTLVTIAGNGIEGYNGDGQLAVESQLNRPYGLFLHNNGDLYIGDMTNNRIRKVSNGIMTTVAGNGFGGYSGDGGLAVDAQINYPVAPYILPSGELIFTEYFSSVVRKVSNNGIISTIAGNGYTGFSGDGELATLASLNNPCYVFIKSNGELLISDRSNNRIRSLTPMCPDGYTLVNSGTSCEYDCFGLTNLNSNVCSGNGVCIGNGTCSCNEGFEGETCSEKKCPWEDDSISAKTPSIESSIIGDGLKFTTSFVINGQVDYEHLMFIGESGFDAAKCSIVGNESIALTALQNVGCSKLYETVVLTIDDLVKDSNVKKELNGDYLKLTIPITLSYLDSTGVSNNGFCRGYTFFTTQIVYFKIIANAFSSYQQDFNYIYGVKVYPQSFSSNSDGTLNVGLVFESMNSTLNSLSFYNSSNPSIELQVTEQSYLYSTAQNSYFKIGAKSVESVSDLRSLVYFQTNLTYLFTKELLYTFVSIKIDYSIVIPPSDKNFTLQASMSINDQTWTPQNTFKENERIFVQVSSTSSLTDYHLKVNDAFLCCFKEFTSTPTYDPSQGQYACSQYDSNTMSVWKKVVSNGQVADLESLLYPFSQVNNLYGFSFKLLESLFPDRIPRTCYVQANVGLVSTNSRRMMKEQTIVSNVKSENTSPHAMGMFVSQLGTETKLNSATSSQFSVILMLALSLVVFLL